MKKIGFDACKDRAYLYKNLLRSKTIDSYKFIFSPSSNFDGIFGSAFGVKKEMIKRAPMARCDGFFVNSGKIKDELGIVDDKVILYLPTHRDEGKTISEVKRALIALDEALTSCGFEGHCFYKLHPYDDPLINGFPEFRSVEYVGSNIDTYNILGVTDILISDYSSVIFDFECTKKPIIGFGLDLENYVKRNRDLYFKPNQVYKFFASSMLELKVLLKDLDKMKKAGGDYSYLIDGFSGDKARKESNSKMIIDDLLKGLSSVDVNISNDA